MMLRIGFDNSRVNVIPGEIKIIPTATSFPHETTFFTKVLSNDQVYPTVYWKRSLGKSILCSTKAFSVGLFISSGKIVKGKLGKAFPI